MLNKNIYNARKINNIEKGDYDFNPIKANDIVKT